MMGSQVEYSDTDETESEDSVRWVQIGETTREEECGSEHHLYDCELSRASASS